MFMMSRHYNRYDETFDVSVDDLGQKEKKRPKNIFTSRGKTMRFD